MSEEFSVSDFSVLAFAFALLLKNKKNQSDNILKEHNSVDDNQNWLFDGEIDTGKSKKKKPKQNRRGKDTRCRVEGKDTKSKTNTPEEKKICLKKKKVTRERNSDRLAKYELLSVNAVSCAGSDLQDLPDEVSCDLKSPKSISQIEDLTDRDRFAKLLDGNDCQYGKIEVRYVDQSGSVAFVILPDKTLTVVKLEDLEKTSTPRVAYWKVDSSSKHSKPVKFFSKLWRKDKNGFYFFEKDTKYYSLDATPKRVIELQPKRRSNNPFSVLDDSDSENEA